MSTTPKKLGSTVDTLFKLRARRLELDREVKELKAQESQITDLLIGQISEQELTGVKGKLATGSIHPVVVPTVEDWTEVENFVYDKRMIHLFQRRLSNPAYIELLEKADGVPGITPTTLTKFSLTKAKK